MKNSDARYAYEIRQALIEQANRLPAVTSERLSNARRMAIACHKEQEKPSLKTQGMLHRRLTGFPFVEYSGWLVGITAIAPVIAGTVLLIALYHSELDKRIVDTAEIDAAVLTDELPLSAYVDNGFKVFVTKDRD